VTLGRLLLGVGAFVGALYAAGLVYEMDFAPAGCCGLSWPSSDTAAAERRLAAADPKGLDGAAQRKAAVAVLAAAPADVNAWMRLAWADWLEHGVLTRDGAHALDMSYLVKSYAGGQTVWRIGFALDNWSRLTPEGRRSAVREVEIARADADRWPQVREAVRRGPRDPEGRVEAALLGLT
jgi:hypothetical protein